MAEVDEVLAQLVDLGRQIINKGLALRRAADNITPDQFVRALRVAANRDLIETQFSGFDFLPPPGEFRGDVDRINWVDGRQSVIRELAILDVDSETWITGSEKLVSTAGGPTAFDPVVWSYYLAVKSEIRKLRAWSVPAAEYAKENLPPIGGGSELAAKVLSLMDELGITLTGVGIGLGAVVGLVVLVLLLALIRKT